MEMMRSHSVARVERRAVTSTASLVGRPVVVGEIVREVSPNRKGTIGGSALAVVCHLKRSGVDPILMTRVGDDARGHELLEILHRMGVDERGVQVDRSRPTWGTSPIQRECDSASGAYDFLDSRAALNVVHDVAPSLVFQCTTAIKPEGAREALRRIRGLTGVPFFVDIDFAETWMTACDLRQVLLGARWLRMGIESASTLANRPGNRWESVVSAAAQGVRRKFALESVVVELRGMPVMVVSGNRVARTRRPKRATVSLQPGDRDAAAAALVAGVIAGLSPAKILRTAVSAAVNDSDDSSSDNDQLWPHWHNPEQCAAAAAEGAPE
jgi:fructokinase